MTQAELLSMAAMIGDASDSIYEALKYICFISHENFYELNVKDIFKVALHNITDKDILSRLGIKLFPEQIGDLARPEFAELKKLIRYAFAVRVPFLKKYVPNKTNFTDTDIKLLFNVVCEQGAENIDNLVTSDFKNNLRVIKSKGQDEPVFDTEWFKSFVYTHGKEFSAITNRNMFFLGCADALFPLYWATLTDRLLEVVEGGGSNS